MTNNGLTDKEKRLVDEAMSKLTGGKVRIEDIDRMVDEDIKFMTDLQKHVMNAILDNSKKRVIMAAALSPNDIKTMPSDDTMIVQLIMYMNTFIEGLLRRWNYIMSKKMGNDRFDEMRKFMEEHESDWRKR